MKEHPPSLTPDDAKAALRVTLTTEQAAEFLNVSHQCLVGLLETGTIPFRLVGAQRRISAVDLMAHKEQDDAWRDEALAELTRQAQDLGLGY